MNTNKVIKYISLLFLVWFYSITSLNAAHEIMNARLQGSNINLSNTINLFDNKYPLMTTTTGWNFTEAPSRTLVRVGVDNFSTLSPSAYDLTFNLRLDYKKFNTATLLFSSHFSTFALRVKYDPVTNNVTYPDLAAFTELGGYDVKVTVLSIYNNLTSSNITSLPSNSNVYIEAEIDAERYYAIDYTNTPLSTAANLMDISLDPATNEYYVKWNNIIGAEEYDLEWTWMSSDVVAPFSYVVDFGHNSTRVSTTNQFYRITNIFERGFLFVRLRGVGRHDINSNGKFEGYIFTPWTWDDFTTLSSLPSCSPVSYGGGATGAFSGGFPLYYCIGSDHENLKNWQYSATYAEEGKKKEVISYFDGTLRNRQTVTKNNSDNNAIVGETYYDYNGRAAVQALPVPVPDANIKFYEYNIGGKWGFNYNVASTLYPSLYPSEPYDKKHFDEDPGGNCPTNALGMDPVAGSSKYYSTNNTDKNFQEAYVPTAENYPFVQTEFMPDNTGRIRRQSGVGDQLKLGSDHETKYFYGAPTGQTELDRLFGSEVGYYNHYKKNMVIDPNGQVSISYIDQAGRTIATALSGPAPDNLKEVTPPGATTPITEDLLNKVNSVDPDTDIDNNILSQSGKELTFSSYIVVTDAGPYSFAYDMTGTALTYECAESLCYDCIYNLEIDIQDLCDNRPAGFTPIKKFVGNIASGEVNEELSTITYNTNCAGTVTFTDYSTASPIIVNLAAGTYKVVKKLSLDEDAMKYYLNELINNNDCVRSEQSFIDEEVDNVDLSGCNMTCQECVNSLGSAATFILNGGTQAQYDALVESCTEPCRYTDLCESNYIALLADVSPGGQYAEWESGGNCNPGAFDLSVLNTSTKLANKGKNPHWNEASLSYKNEDGSPSYVTVVETAPNVYSPPLIPSPTVINIGPNLYHAKPNQLLYVCDFIDRWKNSWAKELVQFHPEYPYYEWCIKNSKNNDNSSMAVDQINPVAYTASIKSSKDYDSLLLVTDDIANIDPTDRVLLYDPLGIAVSGNVNDPYFLEGNDKWHTSNYTANLVSTIQTSQLSSAPLILNGKVYFDAKERFKNFNGSGLDIWHVAYALSSGLASSYNTVITPTSLPIWSGFPALGSMPKAMWEKYKMLYLSLKQQLQNEAAESFATNGDIPGHSSLVYNNCNDCIGNGSYDVLDVPFASYKNSSATIFMSFWGLNWFLFPDQRNYTDTYMSQHIAPCSYITKDLYRSKVKRFQATSDVAALQSSSNINASAYQTSGKCPVAIDLELLLNTLAQNNVLTTGVSLNNYPSFTKLLYDEIYIAGTSAVPSGYTGLTWNPSLPTNEKLSVDFMDGALSSPLLCNMELDFLTTDPYDWASIGSFPIVNIGKIKFLSYSGGQSSFEAEATFQTGTNTYVVEKFTGKICINIGSCAFDPVCTPNSNAAGLHKLISAMATSGVLCSSSPVSLSAPPYDAVFVNLLGQLLPSATNWNWQYSGTSAQITSSSTSDNISLGSLSGWSTLCSLLGGGNPNNVLITSCVPDPAGPTGAFIINYTYITGPSSAPVINNGFVTGIMSLSNTLGTNPLPVGDCEIIDPNCNTAEHRVKKDLEKFLQLAVVSPASYFNTSAGTINMTTNPNFTGLLQSYVNQTIVVSTSTYVSQTNFFFIPASTTPSNTFTFSICSNSSSSSPGVSGSCCKLTFSINPTLGFTQNDIFSLGKMIVMDNPTLGGLSYNFKMLAQFTSATGPVDTLYGSTSCFPIRECAPCTNTIDYSTISSSYIWKADFEPTYAAFSITNNDVSGTSCTSFSDVSSLSAPQNIGASPCVYAISGSVNAGTTLIKYKDSYSYFISLGGTTPSKNTTVYERTETFATTSSDKCYGFSGHYIKAADMDHELELWINGIYVGKQYIPFEGYSVIPSWHLLNFGGATYKLPSGSSSINIKIIAKPILISGPNTGHLTTQLGLDELYLLEVPCGVIPCINEFKPDTFPVITYTNPCAQLLTDAAINNGKDDYAAYIDSLKTGFINAYIKKCMGSVIENFGVSYDIGGYQYTLYYYDQAGNLVRTVPPAGVVPITSSGDLAQIKTDRLNYWTSSKVIFSGHQMKTTYTYNSLNQLRKQETPDAGVSNFWYDRLGRMVASQNAKQFNASPKDYSYTKYDDLGRIKEVGQIQSSIDLTDQVTWPLYDPNPLLCVDGLLNDATFPISLNGSPGAKNQVTTTYYGDDVAYASLASIPSAVYTKPADYLRSRVAATTIEDLDDNTVTTYNHATYYNYDIHGNVRELVQHNPALTVVANHEKKLIQYEYDLISGKVNKVNYQPGSVDQFFHKYDYDAENRLTHVYTSKDNYLWDLDNKYFYYKYGPLARVETGDSKVNGSDYAYTLQGWIKGVNSNILTQATDIGKDGFNTTASNYSDLHKMFGRDAYGYSLNYFGHKGASSVIKDYSPIDGTYATTATNFIADYTTNLGTLLQIGTAGTGTAPALYNGNISHMVTSYVNNNPAALMPGTGFGTIPVGQVVPQLSAYWYDQLNRIKEVNTIKDISLSGNQWSAYVSNDANKELFEYDANGNITKAKRIGNRTSSNANMDNLTYNYIGGSNKLSHVDDNTLLSANYTDDIDDQSPGNYTYDAIGNLITDNQELITNIEWTVYGKIKKITRTNSSVKDLTFDYDAQGNRISKRAHTQGQPASRDEITYYLRDAQGNVMATYTEKPDFASAPTLYLTEQHLYGSSRIGLLNRNLDLKITTSLPVPFTTDRIAGDKLFELSNHLGNVIAVVPDRKIPIVSGSTILSYRSLPVSTSDYLAFGAPMPGRNYTSASYRYSFNGKEKDPETNATGGATNDYDARIYNPSLGRFLSVDPAQQKYAGLSPFGAFGGNPIFFIDNGGKTLTPGGNITQALADIRSLVPKEYQSQIQINKAGQIEFQGYNNLPPEIKKYEGVSLVNDLISSKSNYKYTVGNQVDAKARVDIPDLNKKQGDNQTLYSSPSNAKRDPRDAIDNLSNTPRGDTDLKNDFLPEDGYDGSVRISEGEFSVQNETSGLVPTERASVVFHELKENYLRTDKKQSYNDAHKGAAGQSDKFSTETTGYPDNSTNKGEVQSFTPKKVSSPKKPVN